MPAVPTTDPASSHAWLSPSAAHRWLRCPGCPRLEAQFPDSGSTYAAEGTLAHRLAELTVQRWIGDVDESAFLRELARIRADPLYQHEMERHVGVYLDIIAGVCMLTPSPYVVTEKRLDLSRIAPGCFGTADCIAICGDVLHVIDFKYGKGVRVDAEENPQLRLYALGALAAYAVLFDIRTVCTHIVQPRLDHYSTETISVDELTAWGETARAAAAETQREDAPLHPGDWCRFCKAKVQCRARAVMLLTLEDDMRAPDLLTDDEIGGILTRAQTLASWVKGLEVYVQEKLLAGGSVPGWKLVEGRSVRTITDTAKAFAALRAAGYDEAMLYERKPLGLTALEKLCGPAELARLIGDCIEKPAGKPTLAPENDKRREYSEKKLDDMFPQD